MSLTEREREMILRCMSLIECGEWPWTLDSDGTTERVEKRERAAFDSAKAKLENMGRISILARR